MATPEEVRIGDFSTPAAPSSPTKEALDKAESRLDADARRDEATLKPMQSFQERLDSVKVTREEAAEIVDSVLLKGYYAKDYAITKTIKARFRTRGARDTRRAQDMLENMRLSISAHYNEMLSRFLLASSLERFGDDKLDHAAKGSNADEHERAFNSRLNYVDNLSDPALRVLFDKLRIFDTMISTVLEEGTIENF